MDSEKVIEAIQAFAHTIADAVDNETQAYRKREKRVTKKLLTLVLERKPTDEEIAKCLPW